jgi:hypothetical protein
MPRARVFHELTYVRLHIPRDDQFADVVQQGRGFGHRGNLRLRPLGRERAHRELRRGAVQPENPVR